MITKLLRGWILKLLLAAFLFVLVFGVVMAPGFLLLSVNNQPKEEVFIPSNSLEERGLIVYRTLKELGGTDVGISAILGNFTVESSITAKRYEGDFLQHASFEEAQMKNFNPEWIYGSQWASLLGGIASNYYVGEVGHPVLGIGLGQWTAGRGYLLMKYAKEKEQPIGDIALQLDFALNGDTELRRYQFETIMKSEGSLESAVSDFLNLWEGNPNDKYAMRLQSAGMWLGKIQDGSIEELPSINGENKPPEDFQTYIRPPISTQAMTTGYAGNAYALGQCTWYVYNRFADLGKSCYAYLGNGGDWGKNAQANGHQTSRTPKQHWAVSFAKGALGSSAIYGHLAFVEYVFDDGSILISEMNYGGEYQMNYRVLTQAQIATNGLTFISPKMD